jgi:hypothetical protein
MDPEVNRSLIETREPKGKFAPDLSLEAAGFELLHPEKMAGASSTAIGRRIRAVGLETPGEHAGAHGIDRKRRVFLLVASPGERATGGRRP